MEADQCALDADDRDMAQMQITAYTYIETHGRASLLKIVTDPEGKVTTYIYDYEEGLGEASNLIRIEYPEETGEDGELFTPTVSYTYNAWSQRTSVNDDEVGRKLSETVNYPDFSKSFSYTYFTNGQKQTFTAPDSTVYSYSYGTNNELLSVQIPDIGTIFFADHLWNRPGTVTYPGGVLRSYEYDSLIRYRRISATDPGGTSLLDLWYEYSPAGNILTKSTEHGDYAYDYDLSSRLTTADNPTLDDETYSYDAVGNRTSASNAGGSISHNLNNELTTYGDVEYVYDDNGNMTQKRGHGCGELHL